MTACLIRLVRNRFDMERAGAARRFHRRNNRRRSRADPPPERDFHCELGFFEFPCAFENMVRRRDDHLRVRPKNLAPDRKIEMRPAHDGDVNGVVAQPGDNLCRLPTEIESSMRGFCRAKAAIRRGSEIFRREHNATVIRPACMPR